MTTVFITGDRSMSVIYPGQAAIEMMRALNQGHKIATGTNGGVEQIVQALAEHAGVTLSIVSNPVTTTDEGKPQWDERTQDVLALPDLVEVVAIHSDPQASSIIKSLDRLIGDETLRLVTPADLLV